MTSEAKPRRLWTEKEDEILRVEAARQLALGSLNTWTSIAAKLPSRTNKDCRKRWSKVCMNVNRGAWSEEEDAKLLAAIQKHGCGWTQVAMMVGTRHADQCAKRWQHSLDPSLDRSKWKPDEYARLQRAVAEHGRSWKVIAEKEFPGRSNTDLKNRYGILERRRLTHEGSSQYGRSSSTSILPVAEKATRSSASRRESKRSQHHLEPSHHTRDDRSQYPPPTPVQDPANFSSPPKRTRESKMSGYDTKVSSPISAQATTPGHKAFDDDQDLNQYSDMEFDVSLDMYHDNVDDPQAVGLYPGQDYDLSSASTSHSRFNPLSQSTTPSMFPSSLDSFDLTFSPTSDTIESKNALFPSHELSWSSPSDFLFCPYSGVLEQYMGSSSDDLTGMSGFLWDGGKDVLGEGQPVYGEVGGMHGLPIPRPETHNPRAW